MSDELPSVVPESHFPSGEFKGQCPEEVPDWYLEFVIKHKRGQFEENIVKACEMELSWRSH